MSSCPMWHFLVFFGLLFSHRGSPLTLETLQVGDLIRDLALCDKCSPIELWPIDGLAGLALPGGSLASICELLQDPDLLAHHLTPSPYLAWPHPTASSSSDLTASMLMQSEWHMPEHLTYGRPYSQLWTLRELIRRVATRSELGNAEHTHVPSSLFDPAPYDPHVVFQALRLPHKPPSGVNAELSRALLCGEATELLQSASFLAEMMRDNSWWLERLGKTFDEALAEVRQFMMELGPSEGCLTTVGNISNSFLYCIRKLKNPSSSTWHGCFNEMALPRVAHRRQLRLCSPQGVADMNATFHTQIAHGMANAHVVAARVTGLDTPTLELAIWIYDARKTAPELTVSKWMKTFISLPQGYLMTWECHYAHGYRSKALVLSFTGTILLIHCPLPSDYLSSPWPLHLDLLAKDTSAFYEGWNIHGIRLCLEDLHGQMIGPRAQEESRDRIVICSHPFWNLTGDRMCAVDQWLTHHRNIGISQVFLYDGDGTLEPIARRYEAEGFVKYFPAWNTRFGEKVARAFEDGISGDAAEPSSYHHCLFANSGPRGADWVLLLHSFDEYLGPLRHVKELLEPLKGIASFTAVVALPWVNFGGSTTNGSEVPVPGLFLHRSQHPYEECSQPSLCVDPTWGPRRYQGWLGVPLMNPALVLGIDASHWARPRPMGAVIDGGPNNVSVYHYQGLEVDRCPNCNIYDDSMLWASGNLKKACQPRRAV